MRRFVWRQTSAYVSGNSPFSFICVETQDLFVLYQSIPRGGQTQQRINVFCVTVCVSISGTTAHEKLCTWNVALDRLSVDMRYTLQETADVGIGNCVSFLTEQHPKKKENRVGILTMQMLQHDTPSTPPPRAQPPRRGGPWCPSGAHGGWGCGRRAGVSRDCGWCC